MDAQSCLNELRRIKSAVFATVGADGKPKSRIIDVMHVGDGELRFLTARGKNFYRELYENCFVSVTAMNENWQSVTLQGKAEREPETEFWLDKIFEDNPSMKQVYPENSRRILEVFVIRAGNIEFFDLGGEKVFRESFAFGDAETQKKGFEISDDCVGCGKCRTVCPQKCIEKGSPFFLDDSHCLRCGLCYEECPCGAVKPRIDYV